MRVLTPAFAAQVAILLTLTLAPVTGQTIDEGLLQRLTANTTFSGQWFLIYQVNEENSDYSNEFSLRRGYITFNKRFNDIISVRFTQDIVLDEEGTDAGNIEMRLKYCLLHIENNFLPVLTNSWWEVGLINKPLFGFEDKVNDYRVQGAMFMDKYKILSSADFGVSFSGLIGGEVNSEYQRRVSNSFPGRLGSYSFGVYNGGGYHAIEENPNKTVEGRLTLRPLGDLLPGLQLGYNFVNGKGNTPDMPDYRFNHLQVTWQSRPLVIAGQVYTGVGNGAGSMINEDGISYSTRGYSLFAEAKMVPTKWALMGRFDRHHADSEIPVDCSSLVGGICYRFLENNKVLLNTDLRKKNDLTTRIYEVAIEIRF